VVVDGENPHTKKPKNGRRWTVKVTVDGKPKNLVFDGRRQWRTDVKVRDLEPKWMPGKTKKWEKNERKRRKKRFPFGFGFLKFRIEIWFANFEAKKKYLGDE
jgi:hypothetical protein